MPSLQEPFTDESSGVLLIVRWLAIVSVNKLGHWGAHVQLEAALIEPMSSLLYPKCMSNMSEPPTLRGERVV